MLCALSADGVYACEFMSTILLFWKDPYQKEFDAKVVSVNGKEVVLDQTCFFPASGGQVGDIGFLNGHSVIDTHKNENYVVMHVLEKEPNFEVGHAVHGMIEWERRYRIMRLHSASHIVYYFMKEVFGPDIKLASPGIVNERKDIGDYLFKEKLDREKLALVEKGANEFIAKGYEIRTWSDEASPNVRYWETQGFPKMPCGGTHPKSLSEIGRIKVERGKKPGAGKERIEITLLNEKE